MKNSKVLYGLAAVVFIAGVLLVGRGALKVFHRPSAVVEDDNASEELKRVRHADLETMNQSTAPDEEVAHSLLRYTTQNTPEAQEIIKKFLTSEKPKIRAAAIEASGSYDWADIKVFTQALEDSDENTRISALRGLGKRSDAARVALVEKHAEKSALSEKEWLAAKLTLIKIAPEPVVKQKCRSEILGRSKKWDKLLRSQAVTELFHAMPEDDELKDLAKAELKIADSPVAALALQYQAAFDTDWLMNEFRALPMHEEFVYQMAAIDFIKAKCPLGWSEAADAIKAKPVSPEVAKYLEQNDLNSKCH